MRPRFHAHGAPEYFGSWSPRECLGSFAHVSPRNVPKPTARPAANMADSTGSILITGANGGFGSALVSHIVSTPELRTYHGIYTVRNTASATALDAALREAPADSSTASHSFEKVSLDLSRLSAVREVATAIKSRVEAGQIPPIRAIVLNAGVEEFAAQTWTEEGLDTTFATNYLSHWLLTLMLLGSMDRERGRVIWICSWSHKYVNQTLSLSHVLRLTITKRKSRRSPQRSERSVQGRKIQEIHL